MKEDHTTSGRTASTHHVSHTGNGHAASDFARPDLVDVKATRAWPTPAGESALRQYEEQRGAVS